jgi:hypothetical protein
MRVPGNEIFEKPMARLESAETKASIEASLFCILKYYYGLAPVPPFIFERKQPVQQAYDQCQQKEGEKGNSHSHDCHRQTKSPVGQLSPPDSSFTYPATVMAFLLLAAQPVLAYLPHVTPFR